MKNKCNLTCKKCCTNQLCLCLIRSCFYQLFCVHCSQVCLLGLLGAQCVNKHQDYDSGLKYWKQALTHLEVLTKVKYRQPCTISSNNMSFKCPLNLGIEKIISDFFFTRNANMGLLNHALVVQPMIWFLNFRNSTSGKWQSVKHILVLDLYQQDMHLLQVSKMSSACTYTV